MRVAVIGAGLSGLVAARLLSSDHDVIVIDKSTTIGGRLATSEIAGACVDLGAQFFTVRGEGLQRQVDDWLARDLARVWCHGFHGREDGYPRYVGTSGMASLAHDLALDLDVRTDHMAFTIRRAASDDDWEVVVDDGSIVRADRVVVTTPSPQSWSLLAQSGIDVPIDLGRLDYHRTIAMVVVLDRPPAVPPPGGIQFDAADPGAPFGFLGDNMAKGISSRPALTVHATQAWSAEHWERPAGELLLALLERAAPWLGTAAVVHGEIKRWRFAGPATPWPDACWIDDSGSVVLAGDAFAGPKFEGAYNSGIAAATAITTR
jgi:renalase